MKTTLSKDRDGRTKAKTQEERNGIIWDINTSKGYRGISTTAYRVNSIKKDGNFVATSYSLLTPGHSLDLASSEARATEKAIIACHAEGLKKFEAMDTAGELPKAEPEILAGQVLFFDGPAEGERREYVYKNDGEYLHTVLADGSRTNRHEVWAVKPISKRFGIGTYYNPGEVEEMGKVMQLVNDARTASEDRNQAKRQEEEAREKARREAIERGAQIIARIPEGVKAVIVGELHRNTSDIQTDYFAHTTEKVIYLAFSQSDRDDFKEMRKAATKAEETKHLSTGPQEIEHREKYSMGAGYYLKDGHSNADGWSIEKISLPTLEKLQEAAGEGRYFIDTKEEEETPTPSPAPTAPGKVSIIEYGKGIAVIGETKPIKDLLSSLGGRFNFRLTCGAGWVFRAQDLERVTAALKALKKPTDEDPTPDPGPQRPTAEEAQEDRAELEHEESQRAEEGRETAEEIRQKIARAREQHPAKVAIYEDRLKEVENRPTVPARLQEIADKSAGRVMIVTPQTPAAWSQHGAEQPQNPPKIAPTSTTARAILAEIGQLVRDAKSGKKWSADAMEEAAEKAERIDAPEARTFAATVRAMAKEHRAKMEAVKAEIKATIPTAEEVEDTLPARAPVHLVTSAVSNAKGVQMQLSMF